MKTYIEISQKNLVNNLSQFWELTRKKIMLTVKANAYGHGLREVIQITRNLPYIEYYAVDSADEASITRELAPQQKIIVLGWLDRDELESAIAKRIEIIVPDTSYLKLVQEIAKKRKTPALVHLKMETGTHRLGMPPEKILHILSLPDDPDVVIAGVYSHFANIEDTTDHRYAQRQLRIFNSTLEQTQKTGFIRHFSCSASALLFPDTYFDLIRVGISAYGFWPSKPTYVSYLEKNPGKRIELKPVLSWFSRVAQIKELARGEFIGYGLTYQTFEKSKMTVIPVGYYDGYDRKFSNLANVIIKGAKAPVRGRICMDMIMADISHIPRVKPGEPVILIGRHEDEVIDADYLAGLIGTIHYEIISRINPLIPRRVV